MKETGNIFQHNHSLASPIMAQSIFGQRGGVMLQPRNFGSAYNKEFK